MINLNICPLVSPRIRLELSRVTISGVQVMHCVMYPNTNYDLPILSMDMVGSGDNKVSLAIIDPCPASMDRSIPPIYVKIIR